MRAVWAAHWTVTKDLARDLIEDAFPPLVPISIQQLTEGWDNYVYLVNAARDLGITATDSKYTLLSDERVQPLTDERISKLIAAGIRCDRAVDDRKTILEAKRSLDRLTNAPSQL